MPARVGEPATSKSPRRPALDARGGSEHRQFPRARMAVPFALWIGDEGDLRFSATLLSSNVSISGAFLDTTFFLPLGTELRVRFTLEGDRQPVEARAEIVREERPARPGDARSGVGIRFVEFYEQTEVSLARLFLEAQVGAFVRGYRESARARAILDEGERMTDAIAAWELRKATELEKDPWRVAD